MSYTCCTRVRRLINSCVASARWRAISSDINFNAEKSENAAKYVFLDCNYDFLALRNQASGTS